MSVSSFSSRAFIGVLAIFALLFAIVSPTLALYPTHDSVRVGKCFFFFFFYVIIYRHP